MADWVNGLVESNPPRWLEIPETIATGIDSQESRLAVRDLIERLEVVARCARIPRSLLTLPTFPHKLGRLAFEHVMDKFYLGTVKGFLHILPASRAIDFVRYHASEWRKDAVNFFRKGTFGYPDLVSHHLRRRALPPKQAL